MEETREAANDNSAVIEGSGNVFLDLGFDPDEAERTRAALAEFLAGGGLQFDDFVASLNPSPSKDNMT